LDKAAPDNPLLLANGTHMGVANSPALTRLGIKKGQKRLPHGGSVILDKNGDPTGVLTDAMADVPTTPTVAELERYYARDIQEFWNQYGFTSVLAITPAAALPALQQAARSTTPPTIRYTTAIWTSANGQDMPPDLGKFQMPQGADPAWYRFGGIKVWIDGENDCRTGYMYQPYIGHSATDPPGGKGSLVTDQAGANRFAAIAHRAGVICMFHCSGDHATDIGLNAYDQVIKSGGSGTIMRIEHFGMFQLTPAQLARAQEMKKRGLYLSVQPTCLLDLVKADFENMGEPRTRTGYQFRAMIDAGLEPAAGSDVTAIYLDNIDPFLAICAAVTRRSDAGLLEPGPAISVTEALKMWTTWAAKSMGQPTSRAPSSPASMPT
jgi:predicted amidohydrolase YtcJ